MPTYMSSVSRDHDESMSLGPWPGQRAFPRPGNSFTRPQADETGCTDRSGNRQFQEQALFEEAAGPPWWMCPTGAQQNGGKVRSVERLGRA